jgi:hypothetical protein
MAIAPPRLTVAWDVFAWIGHRRFARHWCVPQIRGELRDSHQIALSEDAIEDYVRRYQTMVAARQGDLGELRKVYARKKSLILSIDGIQPEKGHETLYVVRELTQKRVWFAEPLRSSTNEEVRRLLERAKGIAEALKRPVGGWMSDKQEAFVQGIAAVFPDTPHGYCKNHFLRDLAKPVLEADSQAKVQMRRKVRGLRSIEQAVLREPVQEAVREEGPAGEPTPGGQVVLDYCAAVRGILNDDQGGPLHPPGLRMAEALGEVRQSLERCVEAKKGGPQRSNSSG